MSSTQTQFQNDNLTVHVKRDPGCIIRFDISLSPIATQAAYQKALKMVNKEISIPGFRKGKAPQDLIQKNYGKHVEREWKDLLLNTAFEEALNLTKIMPLDNKSVKEAGVNSMSLENGSSLFVIYEASPQVPSINPKDIVIGSIEARKVTEKDLERAIEEMRLQKAEWFDVNDRPVAEGDFVDIDIDKIDEPSYNLCKNARFEVAPGKMGEWMRTLLIGHSPGESIEGMSQKEEHPHPESLSHELEEFKPTLCRITLKAIKTAKLHDLNDEFAQLFQFQNLEDLKHKVTHSLNREAEEERKQQLRGLIERELIEKYEFDIPQSLIKEHLDQSNEGIVRAARARQPAGSVEAEIKVIQNQMAQKLDRDFRLYFLTRKVAAEQNFQVSGDEMMQEMMHQIWLESSGTGQSIIDKSMDPNEVRSRLHTHLLITKAIDYLIDNASKS